MPIINNSRTQDYYSYVESSGTAGSPLPTTSSVSGDTHVVLNTPTSSVSFPIITRATAYTAVPGIIGSSDAGKWLRLEHATDGLYTLQANTPADIIITGVQVGAGRIGFLSSTGAINTPPGYAARTRAINSAFALLSLGSGNWDLMGDLGAL